LRRKIRYTIVRLVPDPVREEVINIGLAAATDDGSWFRARFVSSFGKVAAVAGHGAVAYAKALIRDFEKSVPMDGPQPRLFGTSLKLRDFLLESTLASDMGLMRYDPPSLLISDGDLESEFHALFVQLVGRERQPRTRREGVDIVTRDDVRRVVKRYVAEEIAVPSAQIDEGGVSGSVAHPVDFAVYNGQLRSVVHTASFMGDQTHAVYQRAVVAECAWDLERTRDDDIAFAFVYAPAHTDDRAARDLQEASIAFLATRGIQSVDAHDLEPLGTVMRHTYARH
jgi:hypothetical protein